ncbi:MAG: general secretion pathway protein GspK [Sedimentisphaerales bacterium]|nr:general secretion pathway protein GspK [Sedimentisphaerales bacterium]
MKRNTLQPNPGGFILVVVLGAVAILAAVLFGFHHTVQAKLDTVHSFYKVERAGNCARAGLNIAVAAVRATEDLCQDNRFSKLVAGEMPIPVADGTCSLIIVEENGFLNVNRLKRETGELDRTRIDQLLRLIDLLNRQKPDAPRIEYGIVPAIIDWTDHDDDPTHLPFVQRDNLGAEMGYYGTLDSPRRCRNEPVDVIDDLLPVKGMTPEVLGRLRDSLTTFGDGKVNINAAPRLVLESLSEQMNPAVAQMILNRRRLKPFASIDELRQVPGMTDNLYLAIHDTVTTGEKERYYRVRSRGTIGDLSTTIEAVLRRNTQAGNVDIVQYREL